MKSFAALLAFVLTIPGPLAWSGGQKPATGVTNTLLDLIKRQEQQNFLGKDIPSASYHPLITLGTPAGFRIKRRYEILGSSLVEALHNARDPFFETRLEELSQYSRSPRLVAESLISLARYNKPQHLKYFEYALAEHNDIGVRLAAIEALQIWGRAEARPILKKISRGNWSPLMRIWASQALLSLGEEEGLTVLYELLRSRSWIIRAMAARYIGDYAPTEDFEILLKRLKTEVQNDFVITELAIAALKLISKADHNVSYTPFKKGWNEIEQVRYTIGSDSAIEVDPLVIIPPRLYIPDSLKIAATINNKLLVIINDKLSQLFTTKPVENPDVQELNAMLTATGSSLQTRYSDLSYLIVESLAGTQDPLLKTQLERLAQFDSNALVRATALISLAYNKDANDLFLIEEGLASDDPILRFGAMEAVEVGRFDQSIPALAAIAATDPIPIFRAYAAQILIKFGDPSGRHFLLASLHNNDWIAEAMTYWYLGRYGLESDFSLMVSKLSQETNPFVQTEIALSILRLSPF